MRLQPLVLFASAAFAASALVLSPVLAGAQTAPSAPGVPVGTAHYTIVQASDGKTVGSAECTVGSLATGYQIDSHGELKFAKFSYTFTNSNRLDGQLNIVRDQLSGAVNGAQVTFSLGSESTGREFQVSIEAAGKTTTNTFDRHQNSVLLADLDPAAYTEMALFALAQVPTAWVVVPKQNGLLVPANYQPEADAHGTLQGQAVLVHHASIAVSAQNGVAVEIYYTNDGSLLEADLPQQNFYVIHDGFKLDSRPTYQLPRGAGEPPPGDQSNQQPAPPSGRQTPQPPQRYAVPQGSAQPQVQPQMF
ncbi:MAG TPA: hypothetical protein VHX60_11025 [Acidobacteriaceae bacterium]|jgi:hypothetical protein|nr:hypothetical protein [Acidobacteriaceae bacterium]